MYAKLDDVLSYCNINEFVLHEWVVSRYSIISHWYVAAWVCQSNEGFRTWGIESFSPGTHYT